MNPSSYTFVALDLETTGLSPQKDTIIEVAAIKFKLKRDGDFFQITHEEERSMLIDPERGIDEHISMITGITNDMVRGKSKWGEVREKVNAFIEEESIIVGHNVLFDVSMLETHGISLRKHTILDTFELSEIFSGDAESLNLGFLAKKYGFDDGSEHRALDDTKLSVKLFLHYLTEISKLGEPLLSLWEFARNKDESGAINTLLSIMGNSNSSDSWNNPLLQYKTCKKSEKITKLNENQYSIISLSPSWDEERAIIDNAVKNGKLLIISSSKKQSLWLKDKLSSDYKVSHIRERSSYISLRMLGAWIMKDTWRRKESILIIRLIHWINTTQTGSIDEIKWYGDEQSYKYLFELRDDEENIFQNQDIENSKIAEILIAESYNKDLKNETYDHNIETCIIRDIVELENALLFRDKKIIDWNLIQKDIGELPFLEESLRDEFIYSLSIIEEIASSVVPRPTGPNPIPPGEYGETYFYTQKDLWHRGYIWLVWASQKLETTMIEYENSIRSGTLIQEITYRRLKDILNELIRVIKIGDPNINFILEIKNGKSSLSLVPRSQKKAIENFLKHQGGKNSILLGYNIACTPIKKFLNEECGFSTSHIESYSQNKFMTYNDSLVIEGNHIVILGTNLKQLRTLNTQLQKEYYDYDIITQSVSGGKSKILHLYKTGKRVILLGLIDTWKDESEVWKVTETLNVTKIPFDPPNDPIYLAKTVGMSNNFELYSIPMAIDTINTLIGRAKSSNPGIQIFLTDEKVMTMSWGKSIFPELL
ncbi:MAG: hypothetical protein HHAS10_09610 [Candidatus Altimarinota bacterium]